MLSEKFIIEYRINNKSGKMSTSKYIEDNFNDDYNIILNFCVSNSMSELPFKEKVYLAVNNITYRSLCKNPNCSNPVIFKNSTIGYNRYCSNKCVGSDPCMVRLKEEKSIKKYGTKTPGESKGVKYKTIKTNNERYGGNSPMCSDIIRNKSVETLKSNYGVDNPSHSPEITEKRVESFIKNIDKYKKTYKETSLEKYGVEHPWMVKDIHKLSVISTKRVKEESLYIKVKERLLDYDNLALVDIDYDNRNIKIKCDNCNDEFSIHREYLHMRHRDSNVICINCNPLEKNISGYETALYNFINSVYDGIIIRRNRTILEGKEIDIYLPDLNLAFEFNGLYWHSELNKPKNYHLDKTNMCLSKGVNLYHIWEDDWCLKCDIIKSIIRNKLQRTEHSIYARKCIVGDINSLDSNNFLNDNHLQGSSKSSIKIGLYYNNELVSIMCFSKPRGVDSNDVYELSRFCNKIDYNIVGSSSKLLSFFIKKYKPAKIISYSDKSIFDGVLYEKLGFIEECVNKPNYKWVIGKKRHHKSKFRKSNLVKQGYDINKSETDIMYSDVGAFRIWDCGLIKWSLSFS